MIRAFYRNAACVFLMFSLTKYIILQLRPDTLLSLNRWIDEVRK
jgi:hypothetical protein